jgi:putrescine transport system substrate-binding protein
MTICIGMKFDDRILIMSDTMISNKGAVRRTLPSCTTGGRESITGEPMRGQVGNGVRRSNAANFRFQLGVSIAVFCALAACSRHEMQSAAAPPIAGSGVTQATEEKVLNLASWSEYIAPDTVPNFERETGIKVRYQTYDNNEVLESKLMAGHTNFDVVVPTAGFLERQRKANIYQKLDLKALTNLGNADPEIMRLLAVDDPGNLYAVPYMFSITGLGYNVEQVGARLGTQAPTSWALLFDPKNAAKLKDCGIAIIDSPIDVFASAIQYLGHDPNRFDPADIAAASAILQNIRPFIRYIDPAQHVPDLANGSLCLSLAWAGDIGQARRRAIESKTEARLNFFVPREGGLIIVDMMAIPADAPHPRNALLWLNYLLRPEVIAGITNYIKYPNGNRASLPLVQFDIKSDRTIYPDEETRKRLIPPRDEPAEYARLITREWTRFRTGH